LAKIIDGVIIWEDDDYGGVEMYGIKFKAPYQKFFKWPYRLHDFGYQFYKSKNIKTRLDIDNEFLGNMIRLCYRRRKYHRIPTALVLYGFVRAFGWKFWDDKSNSIGNFLRKVKIF